MCINFLVHVETYMIVLQPYHSYISDYFCKIKNVFKLKLINKKSTSSDTCIFKCLQPLPNDPFEF